MTSLPGSPPGCPERSDVSESDSLPGLPARPIRWTNHAVTHALHSMLATIPHAHLVLPYVDRPVRTPASDGAAYVD